MSQTEDTIVVLVADDEPSTLALVASHVRSRGYTVFEASDGDQAWQLAHEELPDLVVLDVMMPGMSGWEVCRKIREAVSLAHTGVIMLTGIGENLNEMTSPLYGADAYLDKPFEFVDLDARVLEVLAQRRNGAMGRPDAEVPRAPNTLNGNNGIALTADVKVKKPSSKSAPKAKAAPAKASKSAPKAKAAAKKSAPVVASKGKAAKSQAKPSAIEKGRTAKAKKAVKTKPFKAAKAAPKAAAKPAKKPAKAVAARAANKKPKRAVARAQKSSSAKAKVAAKKPAAVAAARRQKATGTGKGKRSSAQGSTTDFTA